MKIQFKNNKGTNTIQCFYRKKKTLAEYKTAQVKNNQPAYKILEKYCNDQADGLSEKIIFNMNKKVEKIEQKGLMQRLACFSAAIGGSIILTASSLHSSHPIKKLLMPTSAMMVLNSVKEFLKSKQDTKKQIHEIPELKAYEKLLDMRPKYGDNIFYTMSKIEAIDRLSNNLDCG